MPEEVGLTIRHASHDERGGMVSRGSLPPAMCASTKPRFLSGALHHLFRPLELQRPSTVPLSPRSARSSSWRRWKYSCQNWRCPLPSSGGPPPPPPAARARCLGVPLHLSSSTPAGAPLSAATPCASTSVVARLLPAVLVALSGPRPSPRRSDSRRRTTSGRRRRWASMRKNGLARGPRRRPRSTRCNRHRRSSPPIGVSRTSRRRRSRSRAGSSPIWSANVQLPPPHLATSAGTEDRGLQARPQRQ